MKLFSFLKILGDGIFWRRIVSFVMTVGVVLNNGLTIEH